MISYRSALGLALLVGALAACSDPSVYRQSGTPVPGYGNAVRHNSSVMIIDPQPATAANTAIDLDGRRAGLAIERYRTGTVIPPEEMRTTSGL